MKLFKFLSFTFLSFSFIFFFLSSFHSQTISHVHADTVTSTPIMVDNSDIPAGDIIGNWATSTYSLGYYGANYLHDKNTNKGTSTVKFNSHITTAGNYNVYINYPAASQAATNTPVDIVHNATTTTVMVDESANGRQWNLLGNYYFAGTDDEYALIRTGSTTNYVYADAFAFDQGNPIYTLNTSAANGTIDNSSASTTYAFGDTVTLTATPASGYIFSSWSGDVATTKNPLALTMSSNKNIIANFIPDGSKPLLYEDFEVGDLPNLSYTGQSGTGVISVSTVVAHSGLYSAITQVSPASSNKAWFYQNEYFGPHAYAQIYFYLGNDFVLGNASSPKIVFLNLEDGSYNSVKKIYLNKINADSFCLATGGACASVATPLIRGHWYPLDIEYQTGTGTGAFTAKINGNTEISMINATIGNISRFVMGMDKTGSEVGNGGTIYFDDTAFSASPIVDQSSFINIRHANSFAHSSLYIDLALTGYSTGDTIVASLDGLLYITISNLVGREKFAVDMVPLSVGDHSLVVKLLDSQNTEKYSATTTLTKYVSGTPFVSIDKDNNLLSNGVKIFPVGLFYPPDTNKLSGMLAANLINVASWNPLWSANYSVNEFTSYLQTVSGLGVKTFGPDSRYPNYLTTNAPNTIAQYTSTFRNNQSLLFWTWADEPDLKTSFYTPALMDLYTAISHVNDPNHPNILNLYGYVPDVTKTKGYLSLEPVADILSFDVYPVWASNGDTQMTMSQYTSIMDEFQKNNFGLTPFTSFVEACDMSSTQPHLTPELLKMEIWLNVIHGMKGISWYNYDSINNNWIDIPTDNAAVISQFVTDMQTLAPAVLGSNSTHAVTDDANADGNRVDTMIKETDSDIWIFATRLSEIGEMSGTSTSVNFNVSDLADKTVNVYGESNRTINMTGGAFSDSFMPGEVHIYQISKTEIPPTPQTCTSFTYSAWSPAVCPVSGTQGHTVVTSSPDGCTGGSPVLSQTCTYVPTGGGGGGSSGGGTPPPVIPKPLATTTATSTLATSTFTATVTSAPLFLFTHILNPYTTDSDIKQLQIFLNTHNFIIATTGTSSPNHETTYFNDATRLALIRFQTAHYNEILKPAGVTKGTGVFGLGTIKYVNDILKQETVATQPSVSVCQFIDLLISIDVIPANKVVAAKGALGCR